MGGDCPPPRMFWWVGWNVQCVNALVEREEMARVVLCMCLCERYCGDVASWELAGGRFSV